MQAWRRIWLSKPAPVPAKLFGHGRVRGREPPWGGRGGRRPPGSEALHWRQPPIPAEEWRAQQVRKASGALYGRMSLEATHRDLELPHTSDHDTYWHYRFSMILAERELSFIAGQEAAFLVDVASALAALLRTAVTETRCEYDNPEIDPPSRLSLVISHYQPGPLAARQLQALELLVRGVPAAVCDYFERDRCFCDPHCWVRTSGRDQPVFWIVPAGWSFQHRDRLSLGL